MQKILNDKNVKGPVNLLFARSDTLKKNKDNNYKMSGQMPKIKVQTESNSRPTVQLKNPTGIKGIDVIKDSDDSASEADSVSSGSTVSVAPVKSVKRDTKLPKSKTKFNAEDYQNFINNSKTKTNNKNDIEESDEDSASEYSDYSDYSDAPGSESGSSVSSKNDKKDSKTEKQEILLKLVALEKKGVTLTKKYSMSSKLSDLKFELNLHRENAEVEASVKLQQKILMAAVTGLEFANKTFDPIGAKLEGWSESVMDNIDDYESVFVRLHEKYKSRAELPPELQLLVTLAGSAFMFHVTKTMFNSALGGGSTDILKNISSAMNQTSSNQDMSGPSFNLASMLSTANRDDDATSSGTVETSKEVTVNQKGKRSLNL
jgi:hypothetical protein